MNDCEKCASKESVIRCLKVDLIIQEAEIKKLMDKLRVAREMVDIAKAEAELHA